MCYKIVILIYFCGFFCEFLPRSKCIFNYLICMDYISVKYNLNTHSPGIFKELIDLTNLPLFLFNVRIILNIYTKYSVVARWDYTFIIYNTFMFLIFIFFPWHQNFNNNNKQIIIYLLLRKLHFNLFFIFQILNFFTRMWFESEFSTK